MDGTPINPDLYKQNYDNEILPMITGEKKKGKKKTKKKQEEEEEDSDDEDFQDTKKSADFYGIIITSLISSILGYVLYANEFVINFYGGFIPSFFDESAKVTMRGRIIQFSIFVALSLLITFWLL